MRVGGRDTGDATRRRGCRLKRRELLLLLGTLTAPRALWAQQKAMPVIGFLGHRIAGTVRTL